MSMSKQKIEPQVEELSLDALEMANGGAWFYSGVFEDPNSLTEEKIYEAVNGPRIGNQAGHGKSGR
jgi:hypothetical protein